MIDAIHARHPAPGEVRLLRRSGGVNDPRSLALQVLLPFLVGYALVWAWSAATGREVHRGLVVLVAAVVFAALTVGGDLLPR